MNEAPHILVVDDDRDIRELLARYLAAHGLSASTARDGAEMMRRIEAGGIDLVVLDLMMPGEDGLSLTRSLRARGSSLPILMLTAMGEEADRILGLEMGADDYLPKPFSPREVLARIKAILRRAAQPTVRSPRITFAGWVLDRASRDLVSPAGVGTALSAGEFELLEAFIDHPRRVLSRDLLLDLTRGRDAAPFDRSIDILVSRLRRKLGDDAETPTIIKTVRGEGYMFAPEIRPA